MDEDALTEAIKRLRWDLLPQISPVAILSGRFFGWLWGLPLSSMLGASSGAARSPWKKWCNQTLRWQRLEFGSMCALHPANVSVCMLACPILFSYLWEHGSKAMHVEQSLLNQRNFVFFLVAFWVHRCHGAIPIHPCFMAHLEPFWNKKRCHSYSYFNSAPPSDLVLVAASPKEGQGDGNLVWLGTPFDE